MLPPAPVFGVVLAAVALDQRVAILGQRLRNRVCILGPRVPSTTSLTSSGSRSLLVRSSSTRTTRHSSLVPPLSAELSVVDPYDRTASSPSSSNASSMVNLAFPDISHSG
uniref:Putative secreted protein n=1 Tax=Ixodes ricinus TaxID=34613 RepID=A0A6B0UIV6_IXORI